MTAQDQQIRAEFEAHCAAKVPRNLTHMPDGELTAYGTVALNFWQAARALPAGMEPVAEIYAGDLFRVNQGPDAEPVTGDHDLYTAAQVLAMLAQGLAPGWQAVPVEPTGDMLVAIMSAGEVDVLRETPEKHQVLLIDRAGIPERYASLLAAAPRPPAAPAVIQQLTTDAAQERKPLIARQLGEWHEDDGPVAWWAWCGHGWAGEPAWIGTPNSSDWPGYHTHWTPHPQLPAAHGIKAST